MLASEDSLVEISPRAQAEIQQIARENAAREPWCVRLKLIPAANCTGFKHDLAIETDPVGSKDILQKCGAVTLVFEREQLTFVQGILIDWVVINGQEGFKITNPKQTQENKDATAKWLNEQNEKRLTKIRAELARERSEQIPQFRKMALNDPKNELAHFRLGQLLMEDGQYAEAVQPLEAALALVPDFAKCHLLLGECLIKVDQKDRAIEVLTKGSAAAEKQGNQACRDDIDELLQDLRANRRKAD